LEQEAYVISDPSDEHGSYIQRRDNEWVMDRVINTLSLLDNSKYLVIMCH